MKILSKVSWGTPGLKLLSYLNSLKEPCKTIIVIRHSAREEPGEVTKALSAPLTEIGKQAAYEFGSSLANNKFYQIHYSKVDRCKETANCINKGIVDKDGKTQIKGEMASLYVINYKREKFIEYIQRDSRLFVDHWFAGHYPQEEIEPAINIAQRAAFEISKNLLKTDSNVIDLYISHDFHILVYLFYWAGILSTTKWIQYLDGFILQFKDHKLIFYYNGGKKEVNYPHWWKDIAFSKC